jgi:predicted dehydrogenase
VHNLDLMRWFFGEPKEVFAYAIGDANRLEAEVAVSASIMFRSGALVNFSCNWGGHGRSLPDYWNIYGTQGDIVLDKGKSLQLGRDFGKEVAELEFPSTRPVLMWQHFSDCIRSQSTPLTNGRDARATLALALKIYESIEAGRPVSC